MEYKPKIGVLFITSGWFRNVGVQSDKSSFSAEVEKIGKAHPDWKMINAHVEQKHV